MFHSCHAIGLSICVTTKVAQESESESESECVRVRERDLTEALQGRRALFSRTSASSLLPLHDSGVILYQESYNYYFSVLMALPVSPELDHTSKSIDCLYIITTDLYL